MLKDYAYPIALALISLFVLGLEWAFPARPEQKKLRAALPQDLLHLVFNGHFLGVMIYAASTTYLLPHVDRWLDTIGLKETLYRSVAADWHVGIQIVVALLALDFMQWGVHNMLHRVPWLWTFHQTHHSVKDGEMDWVVAFRFQWVEIVVYKMMQYFPLAYRGFGYEAIMVHAIFGTLIGHLNHANLDWDYGPLKYILNSPRMHLWHHDAHSEEHGGTVNFAIIFSMWDWIFGTARLPARPPQKLGFEGVEAFPRTFFGQTMWPMSRHLPDSWAVRGSVYAALGVGIVALYLWLV
jgi:sterol desaturase/sphingolipid hydroxylase (fatty acid hydroxylase superfamily)